MLSFTGFWISFPSVFSTFEPSQPKAEGKARGGGGAPPDRARAMRAQPLADTAMTPRPRSPPRSAMPAAGASPRSPGRPTNRREWKIAFEREGGPAEVAVDDATGEVTPPRPPRPETNARLMRRLHDGTGMGLVWQIDHLHRRHHPGDPGGDRHRHVAGAAAAGGGKLARSARRAGGAGEVAPQPAE